MKLRTYLEMHGLGYAQFARMIETPHRRNVHRYALGLRCPNKATMRRISAATAGAVLPKDFFEDSYRDTGVEPPESIHSPPSRIGRGS